MLLFSIKDHTALDRNPGPTCNTLLLLLTPGVIDGLCMFSAPVKESSTIYDAFLEKERRAANHEAAVNKKTNQDAGTQKKNAQVKKRSPQPNRNGVVSLEDALGKVSQKEMFDCLLKVGTDE